jgi:hypothetical protein
LELLLQTPHKKRGNKMKKDEVIVISQKEVQNIINRFDLRDLKNLQIYVNQQEAFRKKVKKYFVLGHCLEYSTPDNIIARNAITEELREELGVGEEI